MPSTTPDAVKGDVVGGGTEQGPLIVSWLCILVDICCHRDSHRHARHVVSTPGRVSLSSFSAQHTISAGLNEIGVYCC